MIGWNLGGVLSDLGDMQRAIELMQKFVDFEREIGHPDTTRLEAQLTKIQKRAHRRFDKANSSSKRGKRRNNKR